MDTLFGLDSYTSPIGRIWVVSRPEGILRIALSPTPRDVLVSHILSDQGQAAFVKGGAINQHFLEELEAYFSGSLRVFTSRPLVQGTAFQNRVWQALCAIPYGTVKTYGEVAAMIGKPLAFRAVGQANGANPLPILVPCHRVVSRQGIGGFSSGLAIKKRLLALEARMVG